MGGKGERESQLGTRLLFRRRLIEFGFNLLETILGFN
jgi:hypothetical protein